MGKRLQKYVKYTSKELDSYTRTKGSCVLKINSNLHLSIGPYALTDFKNSLLHHITQTKIGFYNLQLDGVVLDIKNVKVLDRSGALRFDDPKIHVDINADCYIFRPVAGAVLSGIVKHISSKHVGVIIYRVFNATILFFDTLADDDVEMDKEVKFRINNYNMLNVFPYIEGELVTATKKTKAKYSSASEDERKSSKELNDMISLIKAEPTTESEELDTKEQDKREKKALKRKRAAVANVSESNSFSGVKSESRKSFSKKAKKKANDIEQFTNGVIIKKEIASS